MINVIVADDHKLFRAGLIRMLEELVDVAIVAEAGDGPSVLQAVRQHACDIIILDLNMPGVTGADLIAQIHDLKPQLPILVLSMHDETATVRQAIKRGASGYITKGAGPDTLQDAVAALSRGERYVAPDLSIGLAFNDQQPPTPSDTLSAREKEVLELIAAGLPLTKIAERLCVSPKTVTTHKSNLMVKLNITNNTDLIRYALEHGFRK